ncbi:DUF6101 family protein [Salinarimonas soli]|uniref:Uncharacterized protein n=1 Tax=Salinarimonas soli TaxID=1638099 RepID=A0A5B2VEK4_9HYPH|nr:DUF6101 family protein [Salinarimonas soli]KAA2236607.1 hypothetical protein F0L46_14140 [Salinarimonas soli]
MPGLTPISGVVPPCEGDPGTPPPLTAGHAIAGPDNILGLRGRRAAGLALRLAPKTGEAEAFEIAIIDERGAVAQALGPYEDDDVVAVWRALADASGLPLLVQTPDGALSNPYPQIGPLKLGATRMRRRHGLLAHRRPRFLAHRKTAALPVRPLVFREPALSEGGQA